MEQSDACSNISQVTLRHLLAMLDEGRLINGPIFDDVHDLHNIGVVR
jgi:hypothetical protein